MAGARAEAGAHLGNADFFFTCLEHCRSLSESLSNCFTGKEISHNQVTKLGLLEHLLMILILLV